jgi:hypothetical protein
VGKKDDGMYMYACDSEILEGGKHTSCRQPMTMGHTPFYSPPDGEAKCVCILGKRKVCIYHKGLQIGADKQMVLGGERGLNHVCAHRK